ncbi:carbonic anhydrase [Salinicola endophyticus]|uniref:Carbonic anhydrase n=1 Tax=Salinicola endophyticus TaxID=1949083 RepID=A0ABY8FG66_9GAMM|nr:MULTISPECIES: carbonic anhydrase [Salinicola]WFF41795.1 carbonic anhydrase [Salinicola endophyticus]
MQFTDRLLLENRAWAAGMQAADPEIFTRLHQGQAPGALWISCCDSRVPAEQICNASPGELFIHRNIANLVNEHDANVMSVIEYALNALEVEHIIVCGHRGCGGIQAAISGDEALNALPRVEAHVGQLRQLVAAHANELNRFTRLGDKVDHVVELNVAAQVERLAGLSLVRESWAARRAPTLHGWVYDLASGQIDDVVSRAATDADADGWRRAAS